MNNSNKPKYWWLVKSASYDEDTMMAYDVDGGTEDWRFLKGIYVVEERAYHNLKAVSDQMKEALLSVKASLEVDYHGTAVVLADFEDEHEAVSNALLKWKDLP